MLGKVGKICTTSQILKASSRCRAEIVIHISHSQSSDGGAHSTHAEGAKPGIPDKQTHHSLWNHGWLVTALEDNNSALFSLLL